MKLENIPKINPDVFASHGAMLNRDRYTFDREMDETKEYLRNNNPALYHVIEENLRTFDRREDQEMARIMCYQVLQLIEDQIITDKLSLE